MTMTDAPSVSGTASPADNLEQLAELIVSVSEASWKMQMCLFSSMILLLCLLWYLLFRPRALSEQHVEVAPKPDVEAADQLSENKSGKEDGSTGHLQANLVISTPVEVDLKCVEHDFKENCPPLYSFEPAVLTL